MDTFGTEIASKSKGEFLFSVVKQGSGLLTIIT